MAHKLLLLGVVISMAVILGLAGYMNYKTRQVNRIEAETTQIQEDKTNLKGTIWDILNSKQQQKCTFSTLEENSNVQGVIYLGLDQLLVKSTTKREDGEEIGSNMLKLSDFVYVWTEESVQGVKYKTDQQIEDMRANGEKTESLSNLANNAEYNCEEWPVDPTFFQLPENVNFLDMTQ